MYLSLLIDEVLLRKKKHVKSYLNETWYVCFSLPSITSVLSGVFEGQKLPLQKILLSLQYTCISNHIGKNNPDVTRSLHMKYGKYSLSKDTI